MVTPQTGQFTDEEEQLPDQSQEGSDPDPTAQAQTFDEFVQSQTVGFEEEPPDPQEFDEFVENNTVDLDSFKQESFEKNTWNNILRDTVIQGARGVAKAYTYPADILKMAMLGEALDTDELEEAHWKAGKEFNKDEYVRSVLQQSEFIPTQDLIEKGVEELGLDLQPKSDFGKMIKQFFNIASFARGRGTNLLGTATKKAVSGTAAVATTETLKSAGVSEGVAELVGDVTGLAGPELLERAPVVRSPEASKIEQIAQEKGLPFWEGMAGDSPEFFRPKISRRAGKKLKDEFNLSMNQAVDQVVQENIPISRLRARGVDVESLTDHAFERVQELAAEDATKYDLQNVINTIDRDIERIEARAPSPSDADKKTIDMLKRERANLVQKQPVEEIQKKIEAVENTQGLLVNGREVINLDGQVMTKEEALTKLQNDLTAPDKAKAISGEELVQQTRNWNHNLKGIYKKPEFTGAENEIRLAYENLKNSLNFTLESQGPPELSEAHTAANKMYSEMKSLYQTESILGKATKDGQFDPKKLEKILDSKDAKLLERNLGGQGVQDLRDITKVGKKAMENVIKLEEKNPSLFKAILSSPLAPFIFFSQTNAGVLGKTMIGMVPYVRGYLLSKPAASEAYKLAMENAAKANWDAVKNNIDKMNESIADDYGDFDTFIKNGMDGLEIFDPVSADESEFQLK